MFTLITNGEVLAPEPRGRVDVLIDREKILKVGPVDRHALDRLGVETRVIDADGGWVVPGFIDPHEHLLGGSGERGFSTQTPEIWLSELAPAGITTVVGTLGVDTTMKTLPGLLAKVKGLHEDGLSAFMWTGGYNVPPTTITSSARDDILFIQETIGAGEIAIADVRATEPDLHALATVVTDAYVGGMLGRKAGVTHFHVGEGPRRLQCLRELLDPQRFQIQPGCLYATHVERNEKLLGEAIELVGQGSYVDMDVVDGELHRWLRFYLDRGGDPAHLTISSDASVTRPMRLYEQFCTAVVEYGFELGLMLPLITSNVARILKLNDKGILEEGRDGDVVVLRRGSLEIDAVVARGTIMVRDSALVKREEWLENSDRRVELHGEKDD